MVEKVVEAGDYRVRYQMFRANSVEGSGKRSAAVDVTVIGENLTTDPAEPLWEKKYENLPGNCVRNWFLTDEFWPLAHLGQDNAAFAVASSVEAVDLKTGQPLWQLRRGNTWVKAIQTSPDHQQAIVMYRAFGFESSWGFNAFCISPEGTVLWQAELDIPDDFTAIEECTENHVRLFSSHGHRCDFDWATGNLLKREWTKP